MAEEDKNLPTEIMHHILSFVPLNQMENLKLVNRDFYSRCSFLQNRKMRSLKIDIGLVRLLTSQDDNDKNYNFNFTYSWMMSWPWHQ